MSAFCMVVTKCGSETEAKQIATAAVDRDHVEPLPQEMLWQRSTSSGVSRRMLDQQHSVTQCPCATLLAQRLLPGPGAGIVDTTNPAKEGLFHISNLRGLFLLAQE